METLDTRDPPTSPLSLRLLVTHMTVIWAREDWSSSRALEPLVHFMSEEVLNHVRALAAKGRVGSPSRP